MQPITFGHTAVQPVATTSLRFAGQHFSTNLDEIRAAVADTFGEEEAKNVNANTVMESYPKGVWGMLRSILNDFVTSRVNGGFTKYQVSQFDTSEERDTSFQDKTDNWGSPRSQAVEKSDDRYVFMDRSLGVDFKVSLAKLGKDSLVLITKGERRR